MASSPGAQDEEAKAPDLELNVLVGIEDVTEKVNQGVAAGMDDAKAGEARRKAMAAIEKEATEKNGLRNDVVTLYQGGQYHLYTYKKYTDVRLVFAPEFDIAFFGGDPDNFEYPRYDLDVCFFRAYEHGKPAKIEHYLKWSADRVAGRRPGLRRRPPRPDRPAEYGGQPRVAARRRVAAAAGLPQGHGGLPAGVRPPQPRGVSSVQGGSLHDPEQPQGAGRRASMGCATSRS